MNDRFKFRAWDKNKKVMIYDAERTYDGLAGVEDWNAFVDVLNDDNYIVEQCTGLKDKNGRLIYEGDIVKQFNNHGRLLRVGYIVYNEKEMKYKIREERCPDWNEKTDDFTFHPLKQRLLVIGNIHENGVLQNED